MQRRPLESRRVRAGYAAPMAARADSRALRTLGTSVGALGSLTAHGLLYLLLTWTYSLPSVDFEVHLPSQVEIGLAEPPRPAPAPHGPELPAAGPAQAAASAVAAPKPKRVKPPARKRPEPGDAGTADAASPGSTDAGGPRDAGILSGDAGRPLLAAYAPAGAQLALRLHIARIRESSLAQDVSQLLQALPDWQVVTDGSGLDPLRDLERLYLASPDLQRASVVVAGQYAGDEEVPRRAVASLAKARGITAAWRKHANVPVAPWANADETARVIALIGPQQFAITRPEDLSRVLQIARALAERAAKQHGRAVDPGDALLGLEHDQLLAFSIEGAQQFARGNLTGVPNRLELTVRARDDGVLEILASGYFESARAAADARTYWEHTRDRFADHPLIAFIGMRAPLSEARFSTDGDRLDVRSTVTEQQARMVLGFARNAFAPSPTARPAGGVGASTDAPPAAIPAPRRALSPLGP
jgi:hypothetical protein